jgi:chemotaxis protein methyltransferase CheR
MAKETHWMTTMKNIEPERKDHGIAMVNRTRMTAHDFNKLSAHINRLCGIKMPIEKKTMLECRLQKRLFELRLSSFKEYSKLVLGNAGQQDEIDHMIDAVTTNKTEFFREPMHFDFLTRHVLPELSTKGYDQYRPLKVWSAGCSNGMEAYTLAMVLSEFDQTKQLHYNILGTDISTRVLSVASKGIYAEESIANLPIGLKRKYFMKSKDRIHKTTRVVPEIRGKVQFRYLNFMEDDFGIENEFDIIFCRNVLIYFDRPTQEKVIRKLARKLTRKGFLFLGHSESVLDMQLPLVQIKPTTLQRIA